MHNGTASAPVRRGCFLRERERSNHGIETQVQSRFCASDDQPVEPASARNALAVDFKTIRAKLRDAAIDSDHVRFLDDLPGGESTAALKHREHSLQAWRMLNSRRVHPRWWSVEERALVGVHDG